MQHKFLLQFDKENHRLAYRQCKNLTKWLEDRNIKYQFEHGTSGHYWPDAVIIEDNDDAILFKLTFNNVPADTIVR